MSSEATLHRHLGATFLVLTSPEDIINNISWVGILTVGRGYVTKVFALVCSAQQGGGDGMRRLTEGRRGEMEGMGGSVAKVQHICVIIREGAILTWLLLFAVYARGTGRELCVDPFPVIPF